MPATQQISLYQQLLNNREALQQLAVVTTLADFTALMQQFLQWAGDAYSAKNRLGAAFVTTFVIARSEAFAADISLVALWFYFVVR
jgi:hypothetical protein